MTNRPVLAIVLAAAACGSPTAHPAGPGGADAPRASDATATADAAGDAAPGQDPATDGPYAVTVTDVTIPASTRQAAATTFVPAAAPSPRPLVFVSPGFQMARSQYTSYAHHLATWGMTVVLADYTDTGFFPDHAQLAGDISTEITWALAQPDLAIDATKIATAGHSLGGKLSVLVADGDSRVTAVVGWDPVDGGSPSAVSAMANLHAAVAVVGETTDGSGGGMPCAPAAQNFATFYAAAPSPALAMTISDADHMDWVDDASCALCSLCTAGTAPADRARTATRRLDVAWLRAQLLGDTSMTPWLASPPEVIAGVATVARK